MNTTKKPSQNGWRISEPWNRGCRKQRTKNDLRHYKLKLWLLIKLLVAIKYAKQTIPHLILTKINFTILQFKMINMNCFLKSWLIRFSDISACFGLSIWKNLFRILRVSDYRHTIKVNYHKMSPPQETVLSASPNTRRRMWPKTWYGLTGTPSSTCF